MKSNINEHKNSIKTIAGKKIFLMLVFFVTAFAQYSFAQNDTKAPPAQLLNAYYHLKDALVSSNASSAATNANELVKAINSTDKQTVNDDARASLIKDANAIAQSSNIKIQRKKFATLSTSMVELAKKAKLSAAPVYQQYCPMEKSSWLSSSKAIKNPYLGSAMLTCGSVKSTL